MSWPTTSTPNKEVFVTCRFAPDAAADLDAARMAAGQSKSAYVRSSVRRCIEADKRAALRLKGTGSSDE